MSQGWILIISPDKRTTFFGGGGGGCQTNKTMLASKQTVPWSVVRRGTDLVGPS